MNKNYKVIKINGFRGVLTAIFIIGCALTGFIVFPGWVCMNIWNACVSQTTLPVMTLVHGCILWAIIGLSIYALNNSRSLVGFSSHPALSEEQIKDIMDRVKRNTKNHVSHTNPMDDIPVSENKDSVESLDTLDTLEEIRK